VKIKTLKTYEEIKGTTSVEWWHQGERLGARQLSVRKIDQPADESDAETGEAIEAKSSEDLENLLNEVWVNTPPIDDALLARIEHGEDWFSDKFIYERLMSLVKITQSPAKAEWQKERETDFKKWFRETGAEIHFLKKTVRYVWRGASLKRSEKPKTKKQTPLQNELKVPSNRLMQAVVESLMPNAMKNGAEAQDILEGLNARGMREAFWAVYPVQTKTDDLHGVVGFRENPGDALWEFLQKQGDLAVRAQFALWARAYQENNAEPNSWIILSVTQFCDDIGFKRHKGIQRRENKQKAVQILEAVTAQEIAVQWRTPEGKLRRMRGPLWQRGALGEEYDEYADLFGANRLGDPENWDPVAFAYTPGFLFGDQEWRKFNKAVAIIGKGLLQLTADNRDKWAVLIGGYIALQARMNGYRPSRFKISTLLEKTGLHTRGENRNLARVLDSLYKSLDRLKEVKVIGHWFIVQNEQQEKFSYDDLNSAETRSRIAKEAATRRNTTLELNQVIEINWTEALVERGNVLQEAREKAVKQKSKKSKKND
jgi:hypothetical protein